MNIVFWLCVVVIGFSVWWMFSPAFNAVGSAFKEYAQALKNKICNNEKENEK